MDSASLTDTAFELYLASSSPRRSELLDQIGVRWQRLVTEVSEHRHPGEVPEVYVLRLALAKARATRARLPGDDPRPVLGADTAVVAADGTVLGKPRDRDDARAMLERLSGAEHHVYSGVALVRGEEEQTRLSVSTVRFRVLTPDEIAAYWASGEPHDKAGGYAVQGLGALFIEHIAGSYSGIMGLPIFETAELLMQFGIKPLGGMR